MVSPTSAAVTPPIPRPPHVDGRRREAKRWTRLQADYRDALGHPPSPAEDGLLRSLVATTMALEAMEGRLAWGEPVEAEALVSLSRLQVRLLANLGLSPTPTPEKPDPEAHLAKIRDPEYWRRKREAEGR